MIFIVDGQRIATENFLVGQLYKITYKNENIVYAMCDGIGHDFVMFISDNPRIITLNVETAQTIDTIMPAEAGSMYDYNDLENKPKINNITLIGTLTSSDLGLQTTLNTEQMAAVNSGIDTAAVEQIATNTTAIGNKQDVIDSSHMLSADLVDDSSSTNKFATAAQLAQIGTNENNISSITDITKQQTTSLYFGTNAGANSTEASSGDNGKYNCAVGTRAMQSNTQGDHCTALGFQAMYKNTTGDGNTAIGEDALYENTTGTSNTVVGAHALQNCTGSGNVAIGTSSLQNDTTGFYNVAIGQDAGKGVTVGQKNIFIGANCKASTNVSNCIAIGADLNLPESGRCYIGNGSTKSTTIRGDSITFKNSQGAGFTLVFNQDGTVSWVTPT